MFADLALPSRICPKTPGRHSLGVGGKSATMLSKILLSSRYKTKPNPQQSSTDCRELARPRAWKNAGSTHGAGPLSRDSKHRKFCQFVNENLENFCVEIRGSTGCQPKRTLLQN